MIKKVLYTIHKKLEKNEKVLRNCFLLSLVCLILFAICSEIYFFLVNLYETVFMFYLLSKAHIILVAKFCKVRLYDILSYFYIHLEEFLFDPYWYLKVRCINVHRIIKPLYKIVAGYFKWLNQFPWYRAWGNFLNSLLNQGLDYWLRYLSWLIGLKKVVGPLIFILGWFSLYCLVLYFFDEIIKRTPKVRKKCTRLEKNKKK